MENNKRWYKWHNNAVSLLLLRIYDTYKEATYSMISLGNIQYAAEDNTDRPLEKKRSDFRERFFSPNCDVSRDTGAI